MTALQTARKSLAAARTIRRNQRLGRYQGRNSDATAGTLRMHYARVDEAATELSDELRGLIWAEHRLADRLSRARDEGQDRPELRARLAATRRELKAAA